MAKPPKPNLLWHKVRRALPGSIKKLPLSRGVEVIRPGSPNYHDKIQIKYLGAGGYLIKRGDDAILTAPFFSNPPLRRMLLGRIKCNSEEVDRFLKPLTEEIKDVEAILVGHAHYDHLMDVPHLAETYTKKAKIYGNQTMAHILAPSFPSGSGRLVPLDDVAATQEKSGKWYYTNDKRIRFMAIKSKHAPQFMGKVFYEGEHKADLDILPDKASGWLGGKVLAFLIDFMDGDGKNPEFRIHYQDAASEPHNGFPPPFSEPERGIDLAILCVAGFIEVSSYPEKLISKLQPRFLILGHWENFFKKLPQHPRKLKVAPSVCARLFLKRLKRVFPAHDRVKMPAPGAWMPFD